MAAKPKGLWDDIAKLGLKATKEVVKGVRNTNKSNRAAVKKKYPKNKKELMKKDTISAADSVYKKNPKKYPDARGYLAEGQMMAANKNKNVTNARIRAAKANEYSRRRRQTPQYKASIAYAARTKRTTRTGRKPAIEINR